MDHGLAFALGCLRNPRRVGAIAPASRALAQAVCDEALRGAPRVLIEVGAGTGAITRRLAIAAQALDRFVVYELDAALQPIRSDYLGDPEAIAKAAAAVAADCLNRVGLAGFEARGVLDAMESDFATAVLRADGRCGMVIVIPGGAQRRPGTQGRQAPSVGPLGPGSSLRSARDDGAWKEPD